MKGFSTGANKPKMGMRTVPFGDLIFEDCLVPDENRLGKEGAGWGITTASLEYDRCCILASQLGAMERQLEESIAFGVGSVIPSGYFSNLGRFFTG